MFPKYRGKQVLMRDENGLEKCVACGLCAVACPADAIYLEAAENDGTVMAGPRYAKVYQIHKTRCIFCGYCEEACPVSAIFMGKDYELAVYSKDDFIWDKADLLVPASTRRAPGKRVSRTPCATRSSVQPRSGSDSRRNASAPSPISTEISTRCAAPWSGIPTCRSGCASAISPAERAPTRAAGAALLDQGQQRGLRSHRGDGGRRARDRQPALHPQRHRGGVGPLRSRASAARLRRRGSTPATCRPAQLKPRSDAPNRDDKRRHFVREEVEACKRLQRRRHPDDARGAAAVHRRAEDDAGGSRGGATRGSRRSTTCSATHEAAAAPVRPPPPFRREPMRERRALGRASTGSTARTC